jgi:uncharacterized DUF497 family protein
VQFAWDPRKADANFKKHRVSFDEAATVFRDSLASIFEDPDHSIGERREIIIGHSLSGRLLLVSFVERGEATRLISARQTDARERRKHEESR